MKWILPLLTLGLLSSCVTKPYMVGSVNDQFYKRHRIPVAGWERDHDGHRDFDYSWQARLYNTAHIPVLFRRDRQETVIQEQYVEPAPAPVTYSK